MRPLAELLSDDPAWPLVDSWIGAASNEVVVLPAQRARGEETLRRLDVTSQSVLGAMALETGGVLVDDGWLRLLGSGSERLRGSLMSWLEHLEDALVVGHDAVGGFFALDGGAFGGELGTVHYFSPDTLEWESLELGYSVLVEWALSATLDGFYGDLRWPGWQEELRGASADLGFALYPPPFTKEGKPVANARRALVPMIELWELQHRYARQLSAPEPDSNLD